jgi:hypothetical protein
MILISHRGNISGRLESWENEPTYIDLAISKGFNVEVDVWVIKDQVYLGHDKPQYEIDFGWFKDRLSKLWIHCKNIEAVIYFKECGCEANYFWHEEDTLTLTSKNYLWVYPGKQPVRNSIAVMPEIHGDNLEFCEGICSDFISKYT